MQPTLTTERELYAESDAWNADRIFVTEGGGIGISVGGFVIVAPLKDWHHWAMFGRRVYQKEVITTQEESDRSPLDRLPLPRPTVRGVPFDAVVADLPDHPSLTLSATDTVQPGSPVSTD